LPIIDSLNLGGTKVLQLLPQIAIADSACIVALPLAIDPPHVKRAAIGAAAVIVAGVAAYAFLSWGERTGVRRRIHKVCEYRQFAVELRVCLTILFALAALATRMHVSIMLAGFVFGLAMSAVCEPRRVAKQLFALTEGFLGPLFFVWLGASLDLRELGRHPKLILLGVALGVGAVAVHSMATALKQPLPLSFLAAAQLGVPVAASTLGTQTGLLPPGEPSALILGALVTIAFSVLGGALASRAGLVAQADTPPATATSAAPPRVTPPPVTPPAGDGQAGSSGPSASRA